MALTLKQIREKISLNEAKKVKTYAHYKKEADDESANAEKYDTESSHMWAGHAHLHAAKHSPDLETARMHIDRAMGHLNS